MHSDPPGWELGAELRGGVSIFTENASGLAFDILPLCLLVYLVE